MKINKLTTADREKLGTDIELFDELTEHVNSDSKAISERIKGSIVAILHFHGVISTKTLMEEYLEDNK